MCKILDFSKQIIKWILNWLLYTTYKNVKRKPLPFILLGSNMASVTAWSNDFNFNDYITREFSGYAQNGDVLFLLTTSGGNIKNKQSINLIKLAKYW